MDAFLGTILPWPLTYAPQGWAFCNGQSLPVSQNQALYSLLGTIYGGSANVSFNLPNLSGRMPIGSIDMGNAMPNVIPARIGNSGGATSTLLRGSQIPVHSHQINNTVTANGGGNVAVSVNVKVPVNTDAYDPTKATNVPSSTATLGQGKAGSFTTNIYTSSAPTANANLAPFTAQGTVAVPNPTVTVTSACGTQSPAQSEQVPTVAPYLAINYIIALEGLYPIRP